MTLFPNKPKQFVKLDHAEEKKFVQITIRNPAHFAVKLKSNFNHDIFTNFYSSSLNEKLIWQQT